jgi:putative cardiolipin synthase
LVSDDPAKGLGLASPDALITYTLKEVIDGPTTEVNFDPRSAHLNTEMGFVIDSPKLATQIAAAFHHAIPANAYEVRLSETGDLYWIERRGARQVRHDTEPGTSFWQRLGVWILSMLPIEWML